MELTKSQKTLHIIFRVIMFATFIMSIVAFVMYIMFAVKCSDDAADRVIARAVIKSCISYYIFIGLEALAIIFSIICYKCTDMSATVTRTVCMAIMTLLTLLPMKVFNCLFRYANSYLNHDYLGMYSISDDLSSESLSNTAAMAVMWFIFAIILYFVLAITSIVALCKKPTPVNYYNQSSPYGNPAMYNNPQYGNGAPQYGNGVPQYGNTAPQYGNGAPQYGNGAPQYGNGAPQYGSTAPQYGNGAPQYGNGAPQYGNGAPQYGSTAPQYGNGAPQYGNGAPQYGNTAPQVNGHQQQQNQERKVIGYDTNTGEPIYSDTQNEE